MFKESLSIHILCCLLIASSSFGILYSPRQVSAHEASSLATPSAILSLHAEFKCFKLVFSLTLPPCDLASNSFICSFLSFLPLQQMPSHYNIFLLIIKDEGSKASLPDHLPLIFIIWHCIIFTPFLASSMNT